MGGTHAVLHAVRRIELDQLTAGHRRVGCHCQHAFPRVRALDLRKAVENFGAPKWRDCWRRGMRGARLNPLADVQADPPITTAPPRPGVSGHLVAIPLSI